MKTKVIVWETEGGKGKVSDRRALGAKGASYRRCDTPRRGSTCTPCRCRSRPPCRTGTVACSRRRPASEPPMLALLRHLALELGSVLRLERRSVGRQAEVVAASERGKDARTATYTLRTVSAGREDGQPCGWAVSKVPTPTGGTGTGGSDVGSCGCSRTVR